MAPVLSWPPACIEVRTLRHWQKTLTVMLASCVISGCVWLAYDRGLFSTVDNFFYDLRLQWRGPVKPSGKVVLVLMDEASSQELERRKGAWSRHELAIALDNLCRAGAEIIGIDLILAAPDLQTGADEFLAQVIADCNNVVLARVLSTPGGGEVQPLPLFGEAMIGDGFVDVDLDPDDVLRRIRFLNASPVEGGGLSLLPAFSLEVARTFLNVDFAFDFSQPDAIRVGAAGGERLLLPYPELLIDYRGTYRDFPSLSYADVVKKRFGAESVAGKIVLVGSSLLLQKDFFSTPLSRFQRDEADYEGQFAAVVERVTSGQDLGVACHANAVETILTQRFIHPIGGPWQLALILGAGIFGVLFYLPWLRFVSGAGVLLAALASVVGLSFLLFQRQRLVIDIGPLMTVLSLQFVAGVAYQRRLAQERAAGIRNLFGKYVSPAVVAELVAGEMEVSLAGQRCELTMLFSDLRGFTSLSEQLDAKAIGILLNEYFNRVLPEVFEHRGTVDKLMGDAVMAFFGAPVLVPDHPVKAAEAALGMLQALETFRNSGVPGADRLFAGIGINTGEVTLGNLGSDCFVDYTVIGDAVNLASRLEGLNKTYGTQIILSESTAALLGDGLLVRELDLVRVKGKAEAVAIYELLGYRGEVEDGRLQAAHAFGEGLRCYRSRSWDEALAHFDHCLQYTPQDRAVELYLERIRYCRSAVLPEDWRGVTVFDHK